MKNGFRRKHFLSHRFQSSLEMPFGSDIDSTAHNGSVEELVERETCLTTTKKATKKRGFTSRRGENNSIFESLHRFLTQNIIHELL